MIRISRDSAPAVLTRYAVKWKTALLNARERLATARREDKAAARRAVALAEEKYRHKQVKATLVNMFHGKCAYCESKITHVDYGHIEHYRPKSRFPDLTFEWTNLLFACCICNGAEHKGDRFPEETDNGPLVNPCDDEPAEHLHFQYDPESKLASVYGLTPRGETTEKLLGLNRHDLRKERSRQALRLAAIARFARNGDPEAARLLEEARQDDAPYAAFARGLR
jgi:uncharacterized protein (TIGR02646 family)